MSNHPITPPDDLAQPWLDSGNYTAREIRAAEHWIVPPIEAEQAFATPWSSSTTNPPSLKEQALKGFDDISTFALGELEGTSDYEEYKKIADTVLKALESL